MRLSRLLTQRKRRKRNHQQRRTILSVAQHPEHSGRWRTLTNAPGSHASSMYAMYMVRLTLKLPSGGFRTCCLAFLRDGESIDLWSLFATGCGIYSSKTSAKATRTALSTDGGTFPLRFTSRVLSTARI